MAKTGVVEELLLWPSKGCPQPEVVPRVLRRGHLPQVARAAAPIRCARRSVRGFKGWRPSVCDGRQPASGLGRYASGLGASIALFDFSKPALSFSLSR